MFKVRRKRRIKRGYPVAILLGFEDDNAVVWQLFSHTAKLSSKLELEGARTDERIVYNFHESVVEALKPLLREGVRSVVVTAPKKTTYASDFLDHIQKHQRHLIQSKSSNKTNFAELIGSANNPAAVTELVQTIRFSEILSEITSQEADHIINIFEKHLYANSSKKRVLYSLEEIEAVVYARERYTPNVRDYLLVTDQYLASSRKKNRINQLLQISKNKRMKIRIVKAESQAGTRINQFGGIVFFSIPVQ